MSFQKLPFLDVFKDATGGNIKTPQTEFLVEGEFPVVDQGQTLVAGFVNDRSRVCSVNPPVIVFGDHTRVIKYVDFQFAMGADGTKVLVPKVESDTKYLYYALKAIEIPAAGYSRHYKFLKETQIPLPPLPEQRRIAEILDKADTLRTKRRTALAYLDTLTQSIFLDMFGDPATNPKGWPRSSLLTLLETAEVFVDGDWVESKDQDPKGDVRLIQLADVGDGVYLDKSSRFLTSDTARRLRCTPLQVGDILVARMPDPLGRACLFPGDARQAVTVVDICIIRLGPGGPNPTWLMCSLTPPVFVPLLLARRQEQHVRVFRGATCRGCQSLLRHWHSNKNSRIDWKS